ncbi:site-specific DNA-methyltransferase (plasmid) [Clostridium botulinum]|uniref:Methyltransferase n=1 Tax=Clostridium botulinum C/D str. DC5 TaxID=1443128 RepID=A0A0A0HZL7_CLOBO|nr:site-specific DNA-methyltransferase [Clostridium botulinum]KGM93526.1 DNA methyltransferase [Clostridium botulinum C/D str. DC5]KOA77339.1 DNA methyltransferase [Clostridium botulinum]KOA90633.1 DNA methyltransferase [Clostridium botulinum]KOC34948.1 DNA methyltransferase [Clostridium botulinum]KOC56874.1 DNA methyltransferase [Clostridium botulinum]
MNIEINTIYNMDCLEGMDLMIKQGIKVDAIITDIPQGITKNKWDSVIPFDTMWDKLYKVRKNKTTPIIILTNQPFTSSLICSNLKHFKIMKYWQKDRPSGFLNAKRMPLKDIEEIAIFYEKQCTYNPQFWEGKPLHGMGIKFRERLHSNNNYNGFNSCHNPSAKRRGDTKKYPRQLMIYPRPHPPIHPTEKPVDLIKDLVKTYTNENNMVLDFTIGSGTTAVACLETNRKFIGLEKDKKYFNICQERINTYLKEKNKKVI